MAVDSAAECQTVLVHEDVVRTVRETLPKD